jgi:hemolysin activation/secretion protein
VHFFSKTSFAGAAYMAFFSASAAAQSIPAPAVADIAPGAATQRLQMQRIDANATTGELGDALTPGATAREEIDLAHLPQETPCFPVNDVALDDNQFGWLERKVQPVVGQCVGADGLKVIQDRVGNSLIEHGYITSRVTLPQQSLASGDLALQVTAGRVGETRTDGDAVGLLPAVLPTHEDALLNQRDIDQALENVRRLPSQADARIDIVPGERPGDSDIVLHPGSGKRWHFALAYDNAGQKTTGKNELSASLAVDSPLHLYDQLLVSGLTNANYGAPGLGTDQAAVSYSVPFGYAMLSLDASRASYMQTHATIYGPIQYTGEQKNAGIKLSGVVQRSARSRTELRARLFRAINENNANGYPIAVQGRDVYGYEIGASHRHYFGNVQVDASIAWRATLPGISKNHGYVVDAPDFSGRVRMETANVNVSVPFRLGGQPFSYQFGWSTQNALTPVTAPDYFMIGTRYAVRGFDQQSTLAAESGWAVSNELDWYAPTKFGVQALYAGIDAGRVRGPTAPYLAGNTLVGMVVGAKGTLAPKSRFVENVNYDVSLGWPLYKPNGFTNRSPTLLVQVSTLF